jgi:hypothetical protein
MLKPITDKKVNFNGHFPYDRAIEDEDGDLLQRIFSIDIGGRPKEIYEGLNELARLRQKPDQSYEEIEFQSAKMCPHCHTYPMFRSNGYSVTAVEPCRKERVGTTLQVHIPSGQMVIASNQVIPLEHPHPQNQDYYVPDQVDFMRSVAKHDLIHINASNLYGNMYQFEDGSLNMGHWIQNEDYEVIEGAGMLEKATFFRYVDCEYGMYILDRAYAESLKENFRDEYSDYQGTIPEECIFDVEPGCYEVTFYHNSSSAYQYQTLGKESLILTIKRAGDAKDLTQVIRDHENFTCHASQVAEYHARVWPTLYSGDKLYQTYKCFENKFPIPHITYGLRQEVPMHFTKDVEATELPRLRTYLQHGPIHQSSGTNFMIPAADLDENEQSFVLLQMYMIEAFISFGCWLEYRENPYSYHTDKIEEAKESVAEIFRESLRLYPHLGAYMEDFVEWMKDEEAVQNWIQNKKAPYDVPEIQARRGKEWGAVEQKDPFGEDDFPYLKALSRDFD